MRVLVVGGGGREHALIWGLSRSPSVTDVHAAPGNAGIARLAACHPVPVDDLGAMADLAEELDTDLTVIGPEAPLVAGLGDRLIERGRTVFGPSAAAARIEGSKAFAKDILYKEKIPTALGDSFADPATAIAFLDRELRGRAVIKADGLAAGKGVVVAHDRATAVTAIEDCLLRGAFGEAGSTVVVEELLEGQEISAFALVDGETVVPLGLSQDHKRIGDGDTGPNTGGMGAYSPLPFVGPAVEAGIWEQIVYPAARRMAEEGSRFRGLLFTGLMLTEEGPKVLEFNARFGDPETAVVIPLLESDLGELLLGTARGELGGVATPKFLDEAALTVVVASGGYPGGYVTGLPIDGLSEASAIEGVTVFHAGTAERNDRVVTAGGRVLTVTALAETLTQARERAYRAVSLIGFDGMQFRHDIAASAAEGGP
ncbi:MAG: phosphoribosylamine---glycine ligase [Actinomycetota bacterium]|jgi:phosphoribosylamine--glycine ligase|nr:phosphoribosylamine---glycine ligase [Actinomycetota bacterium]